MAKIKTWLLRLFRKSIKLVAEEAITSAKVDLLKELETSKMFDESERVQVENITEMLITKILAEIDKRI